MFSSTYIHFLSTLYPGIPVDEAQVLYEKKRDESLKAAVKSMLDNCPELIAALKENFKETIIVKTEYPGIHSEDAQELYSLHNSLDTRYPLIHEILNNHKVASRIESILMMAAENEWIDDWECDLAKVLSEYYS